MGEAWRRIKWFKNKVGENRKFEIFKTEYKTVTRDIEIDFITGYYRIEERSNDEELIRRIREKNKIKSQVTIIYTDGSNKKGNKSTGASIVIEEQETAYKISMSKLCSLFTAEAFAIKVIKATLELMIEEAIKRPEDILILTDSRAALQAIKNNQLNVYKNKYITEIREKIIILEEDLKKRVILAWIPAHKGIKGNKLADQLAKEATEEDEDRNIQVFLGDLRKEFKKETWNMTQNSITKDAVHKGKLYFEKFYEKKKKNHGSTR